jgi:16S rRNA (guanine527-N7)-methyltransferase
MAAEKSPSTMLVQGAKQMGVHIDDQAIEAMFSFLAILGRWNRVYNLTAIEGKARSVTRHLLDSLSVIPHLQGGRILDVGSGAGLPGVPVSLACPAKHVVLLDANAKRCRFLRQVKAELRLANVEVVQNRAENYQPEQKFDSLLSRAFSDLPTFIDACRHLLADEGKMLAMKGEWNDQMAGNLPADFVVDEVIKLDVPGLKEQRHLVICSKRNQVR